MKRRICSRTTSIASPARLSPARPLTLPAPSQVQAASTSRVHGGKGRSGTVTDRKMVSAQARRVATTVGLDPSTTQGRSDIHALNYMRQYHRAKIITSDQAIAQFAGDEIATHSNALVPPDSETLSYREWTLASRN